MTTIYVAYPTGIIETKDVIKETPKQYLVKSESTYRSKPTRLNKDSFYYTIFPTLPEAQAWCIERMQERVRRLGIELGKLHDSIAEMQAEMDNARREHE